MHIYIYRYVYTYIYIYVYTLPVHEWASGKWIAGARPRFLGETHLSHVVHSH